MCKLCCYLCEGAETVICPECRGVGYDEEEKIYCDLCCGSVEIECPVCFCFLCDGSKISKCYACDEDSSITCSKCDGNKTVVCEMCEDWTYEGRRPITIREWEEQGN